MPDPHHFVKPPGDRSPGITAFFAFPIHETESKEDMMNVWMSVLSMLFAATAAGFFGWKFGYKRGNLDRKNEILQEYTTYVPLGNVGRIARELIEEDGLSENFPMLIIMPSKYDYLEGIDPEE